MEPHGAIAYQVLKDQLKEGETGIFLCTAHPAKQRIRRTYSWYSTFIT